MSPHTLHVKHERVRDAGARWGSTKWDLEAGEQLLDASWAADGRSVLLAFTGGNMGTLYFTQPPPARAAQLLPLPLPEVGPGTASSPQSPPLLLNVNKLFSNLFD